MFSVFVCSMALGAPWESFWSRIHGIANIRISACKRLLLYCRWMIRPDDGLDLGLWSLSPAVLVMPIDTHVHRIARNLGLTDRNDASWVTAAEVTSALREFDAEDPVKYDFALCHLGISGDCPSRRDPQICQGCSLRAHCREWLA